MNLIYPGISRHADRSVRDVCPAPNLPDDAQHDCNGRYTGQNFAKGYTSKYIFTHINSNVNIKPVPIFMLYVFLFIYRATWSNCHSSFSVRRTFFPPPPRGRPSCRRNSGPERLHIHDHDPSALHYLSSLSVNKDCFFSSSLHRHHRRQLLFCQCQLNQVSSQASSSSYRNLPILPIMNHT